MPSVPSDVHVVERAARHLSPFHLCVGFDLECPVVTLPCFKAPLASTFLSIFQFSEVTSTHKHI